MGGRNLVADGGPNRAGAEDRYALTADAPLLVRLGSDERRALAIASKLLDQIGMPFGAAFERLFLRLSGGDRDRARAEADRHVMFAQPALHHPPVETDLATRLYDLCLARPRRPVRFRYDSRTTPDRKDRRVVPLGLVFHDAWYLVGWDAAKAPRVRLYAVARMSGLREDAFGPTPPDADLDVAAHMAGAWRLIVGDGSPRRVVLRMPERLAKGIKHRSQLIEGHEGDETLVTYAVSEPDEMASFILSHADEIIAIEPASLRKRIVRRLETALGRYLQPSRER